jgi:hypothetical protein
MNNIASGLGLPTKFIRYNPDNKQFTKKHKEIVLVETIKNNIALDFMEPIYLFRLSMVWLMCPLLGGPRPT